MHTLTKLALLRQVPIKTLMHDLGRHQAMLDQRNLD